MNDDQERKTYKYKVTRLPKSIEFNSKELSESTRITRVKEEGRHIFKVADEELEVTCLTPDEPVKPADTNPISVASDFIVHSTGKEEVPPSELKSKTSGKSAGKKRKKNS